MNYLCFYIPHFFVLDWDLKCKMFHIFQRLLCNLRERPTFYFEMLNVKVTCGFRLHQTVELHCKHTASIFKNPSGETSRITAEHGGRTWALFHGQLGKFTYQYADEI